MAEFSKQWVEENESDIIPDFDILEVASTIKNNHYMPMICEGYGFGWIAKNENGEILLGIRDFTTNEVTWKPYNEVVEENKNDK